MTRYGRVESFLRPESTILGDKAWGKRARLRVSLSRLPPWGHRGAFLAPTKECQEPAAGGSGTLQRRLWDPQVAGGTRLEADKARRPPCSTSKQILTGPKRYSRRRASAQAFLCSCAKLRLKSPDWQKAGGSWFRGGRGKFPVCYSSNPTLR